MKTKKAKHTQEPINAIKAILAQERQDHKVTLDMLEVANKREGELLARNAELLTALKFLCAHTVIMEKGKMGAATKQAEQAITKAKGR